MQCYKTLAAITLVANKIDSLPNCEHKLPYNLIADWMGEHDIDAEDILFGDSDAVSEMLVSLITQDQPHMPRAA